MDHFFPGKNLKKIFEAVLPKRPSTFFLHTYFESQKQETVDYQLLESDLAALNPQDFLTLFNDKKEICIETELNLYFYPLYLDLETTALASLPMLTKVRLTFVRHKNWAYFQGMRATDILSQPWLANMTAQHPVEKFRFSEVRNPQGPKIRLNLLDRKLC